jgi:hypothetical protein
MAAMLGMNKTDYHVITLQSTIFPSHEVLYNLAAGTVSLNNQRFII